MTEQKAKQKIENAGGNWNTFLYWMRGQTVSIYPDGTTCFYECDVDEFIKGDGNINTKIKD